MWLRMELVNKIEKIITKYSLPLFLFSLLLIKIPPFYLFFPIKSALLTTHMLARLIILILFAILAFRQLVNKETIYTPKAKALLVIFFVYFVFQSLSVISAVNATSFLQRYKNILFPGFFLFVAITIRKHSKKVVFVFLVTAVFNFFYQMFMFWSPNLFRSLGEIFVYSGHLELVSINLERFRMFIETYDEIAIPFIFLLITIAKKRWQKLSVILLFLMVVAPSLLSNFRSRVLMLAVALIASFVLLQGKKIVPKLSLLASFLAISFLSIVLLNSFFGFSIIDRFALENEREDVRTISLRGRNIGESAEMGLAYPLFGVGLGNYYDHLPFSQKAKQSIFGWVRKEAEIASTNPHNIFAQTVAETGIVSLLFYVGILIYFAREDFRTMSARRASLLRKSFIISFWTLFIYSIFNPTTTLTYNTMFWVLRGMI